MPRLSLCLAVITLALGPFSSAVADKQPGEFKLRYAVVLDNTQPFYAEVSCKREGDCVLVDRQTPDIRLTLWGDSRQGGVWRVSASCDPECILSPERPRIEPGTQPHLMKIQLFRGKDPGHDAVLLSKTRMGDIFIAY